MTTKPTLKELESLSFAIRLLAELMQVSPEPEKKAKLSDARDTLNSLRQKCIILQCQGTLDFASA